MNSPSFLKSLLLICSLLLALGTALPVAVAADLGFIAKDGKAQADIVIASTSTRAARLAAKELQKYIAQISGAELAIGTVPSADMPNHIFVGPSTYAAEHGVTDKGLEKDMFRQVSGKGFLALVGKDADFDVDIEKGFRWDTRNSKMWDSPPQKEWEKITGESWVSPVSIFSFRPTRYYSKTLDISIADEVGTLYAVNEFIRSLGVEWYMPGPSGEVVPKMATIPIPALDETVKPAFTRRQIGFVAPQFDGPRQVNDVLWYFRIGLGYDFPTLVMHSFQLLQSHPDAPKKYPEYFAKFDGKPGFDVGKYGQVTASSPEFREAMVRYARAFFDAYPWAKAFPVVPTDGYWRIADQDKDIVTPERGTHGAMSDVIWDLVNYVAKEVKKTHPDKKIVGLAYSTYRLPPEKIPKLEDNVEVFICWPARRQIGPDARERMQMLRDGWAKITAPGNLNAWDYYLQGHVKRKTSGVPMIYPHLMAQDVHDVNGLYAAELIEATRHSKAAGESSEETALLLPGLNHLNYFITARAYWHPDMDIEAVLTAYYRDFFGPAAGQMREFTQIVESGPWESWTPDQIARLQALLKEAQQVAGDTIYGTRVNMIEVESRKKLAELLALRTRGYEITLPMVTVAKDPETLTAPVDSKFRRQFSNVRLEDPLGNPGARAPFRCEIGFGVSGQYLYLFSDSVTSKAHSSDRKKDDPEILQDDAVQYLIETDRHTRYIVAINSSGTLLDARLADGGKLDPAWESGAESAVASTATGWESVIRIPLAQLGGHGPTAEDYWRFNASRHLPGVDPISDVTVLVTDGTKSITTLQNSARLIPGSRAEKFEQKNEEDGQF